MRSAYLIGRERSSDRIDLYFIFQWSRSVFMRGGAIPRAIHVRTTFVILCNASMKSNGQPATTDSLPYTYTYIFRWSQVEKQKLTYIWRLEINSSLADQLSAAIYSVSQPAKWCDHPGAIISCTCACFACFQSSPAIKSFLELTDCCLVYPTFFAIRLCLLQSLNKDGTISFCWGHFFSFPSHFDRWCFRHQCKRMTSYPMT